MKSLPVLLTALLGRVTSDAFFLGTLDSVLGGNSVPRDHRPVPLHHRAQHPRPRPQPQRQPRKQNPYTGHNNAYPGGKKQPQYPKKTVYPQPQQTKQTKPRNPQPSYPHPPQRPADPGANVKLDYGGWTAIDFDDTLPGQKPEPVQYPRHSPHSAPEIVTLEAAIAAAPKAQSDDLVYSPPSVYDQPAIAPTYEQPAPAPKYEQPAPIITYEPSAPVISYEQPSPSPIYQSPESKSIKTFGPPVPAVPYIPSTEDLHLSSLEYNNPAVAPAYEPSTPHQTYQAASNYDVPAPAPKYYQPVTPANNPIIKYQKSTTAPKYQKPTPSSKYQKPSTTIKYEKPNTTIKYYNPPSTIKYERSTTTTKYQKPDHPYAAPVTSRPEVVVLPAYTPAPPVYSAVPAYEKPEPDFGSDQYPIVAIITADSNIPEDEKYVSFSIGGANGGKNGGSPDSLPSSPGEYQATADTTRLAKDVNGVYVQPATGTQDELYYIYYQDPELDPSYGVKIQNTREAKYAESALSTLDAPRAVVAAPLSDFPVYDYDEAREASDAFRVDRNDPAYSRSSREEPSLQTARRRYGTDFGAARSSVSFTTSVGGKSSGFSYNL